MNLKQDLQAITRHFHIYGEFVKAVPYGSGHINDTYCVAFNQAGCPVRYIFQRINHHVFRNPEALMENILRVTQHLGGKFSEHEDASRSALTLVPTREGAAFHYDQTSGYWRAYLFIERARSFDAVQSPTQAFEAARAFGRFQWLLSDLPAPPLHETIPDFHHTPKRFLALEKAIAADKLNRAARANSEIAFALRNKAITSRLLDAHLPERVTHNDTKFNNVMLDDETGTGVCVIDLDTVMPGLVLYDVGDMVRTTTSPAKEDERDLSKVGMQFDLFEALMRGYLESANAFLTPAEKDSLAFAGKLITFEIGVRFLTDFLEGDHYFKVHRDGHNLDRCRTQFKLVESIDRQEDQMHRLVGSL